MFHGGLLAGLSYAAAVVLILRLLLSIKTLTFLLGRCWSWIDDRSHSYQSFSIPTHLAGDDGTRENALYRAAVTYLSNLPTLEDADEVTLITSGKGSGDLSLRLVPGQRVSDHYLGASFLWESSSGGGISVRVRRQDRRRALRPYLQHVQAVAGEIELRRRRDLRLFTHLAAGDGRRRWRAAAITSPATMETVVMDPDLKAKLRDDLEAFEKGEKFYRRIGRAWRRSYLLRGPPGTGKSSFAAAMARFLNFDLYDLDLSRVSGDEMRLLVLETTPRSVILVEDLDLHIAREAMDGVLSCCGEERVIVFTASGGDDLRRPGRVDVVVEFPVCDFMAFKEMARSHLGVKEHKLFPEVEEGFRRVGGEKLSPAEVGEMMIANRGSPSRAIRTVIGALNRGSKLAGAGGEARFRRLSGSVSENGREGFHGGGCEGGFGKEATIRELKKLCGFIRRTTSKKEGVMTVEEAAAAAEAAA